MIDFASYRSIYPHDYLRINELPILPFLIRRLLRRLPSIELRDNLRVDAVQLLLREDAQQRPRQVQRVVYRARLVWACTHPVTHHSAPNLRPTHLARQTGAQICPGTPTPACPQPTTLPRQRPLSSRPRLSLSRTWRTTRGRMNKNTME